MLSCDTFALKPAFFSVQKPLLAKNSDRPLGEAQPLAFFKGGSHQPGEMVSCTHLKIPQAERTYTVLGSRPYWIWGFEMGVNECGLAIGNEAQGSRCEAEAEEGLLGMDLLRLALERAATAREGVEVIAALLERYGQNANASPLFDRRYENSFLLVDPHEIWLMETAGRQWAARQVHDWAAISNCYSIGTAYDLCSKNMERCAREHRWLAPDEPLNFAKAYTLPAVRQTAAVPRWRRLQKLISTFNGPLTPQDARQILRDHFEGEIIEPRWGGSAGGFVSICMHAATWDASQTAASFLTWHDDQLGQVSWYAPSIPCCSVYIPVYWTGDVPEAMKLSSAVYYADSLWWRTERLSALISADEERFGPDARSALGKLESKLLHDAALAEQQARRLAAEGSLAQAQTVLAQCTAAAVDEMMALTGELADRISRSIKACGGLYGIRKEFLEAYSARVQMPL